MKNKSLSDKSISGFIWLLGNSSLQSILKIIFVAILARLLTPNEFGLMASAILVTRLTETVTHMGVGPALVQNRNLTEKHISSAFTFSTITGICVYFFFLLINPFIADFFNMPDLVNVLNILCIVIPIRLFTQVSYSSIQREFLFKKLAGWDALSYGVGYGAIGILLAYLGFGVYSLVVGVISQACIYSFALYYVSPHSLRFKIYKKELTELLKFGTGFSLAGIFNYLARNGDYIIVGRYLGSAQLGIYSRSYVLMDSVNSVLGRVINEVMFTSFSDIQNQKQKLRNALNKGFSLSFLLILPTSFFAFVYANELVFILLGNKWGQVVSPFRILVFAMLFRIGYKITGTLIRGIGRVFIHSFIQFIYMLNVVLGCYLVRDYGLNYVAFIVGIALFLNFAIQVCFLRWDGYLKFNDLSLNFIKAIPMALTVGLVSFGIKFLSDSIFGIGPILSLTLSGTSILLILLAGYKIFGKHLYSEDGMWLINKLLNKMNFKRFA